MYWHEYSTNVQCVKVSGSVTHGLCKVRISYSLYTDFADYTELFRKITEGSDIIPLWDASRDCRWRSTRDSGKLSRYGMLLILQ